MEDKMILSKAGLICYLMNELGNEGAWEVTTLLGTDGSWKGAINIRMIDKQPEDMKYFADLVRGENNG